MGHSNEGAASCRAEEGFVRGCPSRKSPRQTFEIVIAKTCNLIMGGDYGGDRGIIPPNLRGGGIKYLISPPPTFSRYKR
jgi:hypothetical protein